MKKQAFKIVRSVNAARPDFDKLDREHQKERSLYFRRELGKAEVELDALPPAQVGVEDPHKARRQELAARAEKLRQDTTDRSAND